MLKQQIMGLALVGIGAAALTGALALAEQQQTDQTTAQQMIDALEGAFGKHPGFRKNHAKGMCANGFFVGQPEAREYSRSAIFSGAEVPVVTRLSLGGGDPEAPDMEKGPRGIGIEFRLADGGKQHMTMINAPMFLAKMPKGFLDQALASKPDPTTGKPNPEALKKFAATHPDSADFFAFYADHNPPPSYANTPFFGIHTFKFLGKDDNVTLVKWRFEPEDGEKHLTDEELKTMPTNFLESAMLERVKQGPVKWSMWVTVGEPGDPETDPTKLWPADRKQFKAGTLVLTGASPDTSGECKNINYDPLVMVDGIAPTDDPVLLFRSPSYALSFVKRLQNQ